MFANSDEFFKFVSEIPGNKKKLEGMDQQIRDKVREMCKIEYEKMCEDNEYKAFEVAVIIAQKL
jgi:hypothetical protein